MAPFLYSYRFTSVRDVSREFKQSGLCADVGEIALRRSLAALGRLVKSPETLLAHLVPGECCLTGPLVLWTMLGRLDESPLHAHFVGTQGGCAAIKAHLETYENYECVQSVPADHHAA